MERHRQGEKSREGTKEGRKRRRKGEEEGEQRRMGWVATWILSHVKGT